MLATVLFWISSCLLILSSVDIATGKLMRPPVKKLGPILVVVGSATLCGLSIKPIE